MTYFLRWSTLCSFSLLFIALSFSQASAQIHKDNPNSELFEYEEYFGKDGRHFLRIVGGDEADIEDYPWHVAITTPTGQQFCGGAIIDEYWVVSAAHCMGATPPYIKAGVTNRTAAGQLIAAEEMYIHPNYPGRGIDSDIVLLRLASPIDLSGPEASAIPVITRFHADAGFTNPDTLATVTGWGAISEGGPSSNILRVVDVPIVSLEEASVFYGEGTLSPDMLAAGYPEGGKDACQGDSGGPLVVADPDSPVGYGLAGVVSWGDGCARPNLPGIYARVSYFHDWIEVTTGLLFDGPGEPAPVGSFSLLSPSNDTSLELNMDTDVDLEITWEDAENAGGYYWQFFADEPAAVTNNRAVLFEKYFTEFGRDKKREFFHTNSHKREGLAQEALISVPADSNGGKNYLTINSIDFLRSMVGVGLYRQQSISGSWNVRARGNSDVRFADETFELNLSNTGVRPDAIEDKLYTFSSEEGFTTGSIHEQNDWVAATGGQGIGGLGVFGPANTESPLIVDDIHNGSGQSLHFPNVSTEPDNRFFYAIGPEFNVDGEGAYVVSTDFRVTDVLGADYLIIIDDDETLTTLAIVVIDWLGRIIVIQENLSGVAGEWEPSDEWQNLTVVYNKNGFISYVLNGELLATAPHPYAEIAQPTRMSFMSDNWHDGETGHFDNISIVTEENRNVSFTVDMRAQIAQGAYTPGTDEVSIRGGFNGWESTVLEPTNMDGIYTTTIYVEGDFEDEVQYKFLINEDFEEAVGPGDNGNRVLTLSHAGIDMDMGVARFNNQALPEQVVLRSPLNGATGISLTPTLRWDSADFADDYTLQVSEDSDFTDIYASVAEITGSGANITYSDLILEGGTTYYWRVQGNNEFGGAEWSETWSFSTETPSSTENEELPREIVLSPNFPNPFNPTTTIQYSLPNSMPVSLRVYDMTGRVVAILVNGTVSAGTHQVTFDASNLASGMYIYRLEAGEQVLHNKMLLVK